MEIEKYLNKKYKMVRSENMDEMFKELGNYFKAEEFAWSKKSIYYKMNFQGSM